MAITRLITADELLEMTLADIRPPEDVLAMVAMTRDDFLAYATRHRAAAYAF